MSALNYALELETHVLVPLQTALSAQGAPAPWMEHPIPAEKADGLALWTLRNDKGRCWLPLFTSVAAAGADRSTGSRPMLTAPWSRPCSWRWTPRAFDGVVLEPVERIPPRWTVRCSTVCCTAGHHPGAPAQRRPKPVKKPPAPDTGRQRQSATRKPPSRAVLPGYRCWASACIRARRTQKRCAGAQAVEGRSRKRRAHRPFEPWR